MFGKMDMLDENGNTQKAESTQNDEVSLNADDRKPTASPMPSKVRRNLGTFGFDPFVARKKPSKKPQVIQDDMSDKPRRTKRRRTGTMDQGRHSHDIQTPPTPSSMSSSSQSPVVSALKLAAVSILRDERNQPQPENDVDGIVEIASLLHKEEDNDIQITKSVKSGCHPCSGPECTKKVYDWEELDALRSQLTYSDNSDDDEVVQKGPTLGGPEQKDEIDHMDHYTTILKTRPKVAWLVEIPQTVLKLDPTLSIVCLLCLVLVLCVHILCAVSHCCV